MLSWIHSFPIRTISWDDDDFSDLEPLKQKIGNSRIISLSGASHDNNKILRAKCRLVKFFHEEMGFTVLAWEAGLLDCLIMNEKLKEGTQYERAILEAMPFERDSSIYDLPLVKYASNSWKTNNPMIVAGFEVSRSPLGTKHYLEYLDDIFKICSWLKPNPLEINRLDSLIRFCTNRVDNPGIRVSNITKQIGKHILRQLEDSIHNSKRVKELFTIDKRKEIISVIHSFIFDLKLSAFWEDNSDLLDLARNNLMFYRFLEIYQNLYPNNKIIIWTTSVNMIKNEEYLDSKQFIGTVHFGNYLNKYFGKEYYSIACTTYTVEDGTYDQGELDTNNTFEKQNEYRDIKNSYEYWAKRTAQNFLFTDLRSLPKYHWLNNEVTANAIQLTPTKAQWPKIVDALVYIE